MANDLIPSGVHDVVDGVSKVLNPGGILVRAAIDAFARKRLQIVSDQLVQDLKLGKIAEVHLQNEDRVGGGAFLLAAAIRHGKRTQNIRLLARYLFGSASMFKDFDDCVEDSQIIESLTNAEIRCLAVLKNALNTGWLRTRSTVEDPIGIEPYTLKNIDLLGLFAAPTNFLDACMMLQRYGLMRQVAVWGGDTYEPTHRLDPFLKRLDLEHMIIE